MRLQISVLHASLSAGWKFTFCGWHLSDWAGEDRPHPASCGLEEVRQIEGDFLFFFQKNIFCRQASWASWGAVFGRK